MSFPSVYLMSPMSIIIMQLPSLSLYVHEGMTTFSFFLKTWPITKHKISSLIDDINGYTSQHIPYAIYKCPKNTLQNIKHLVYTHALHHMSGIIFYLNLSKDHTKWSFHWNMIIIDLIKILHYLNLVLLYYANVIPKPNPLYPRGWAWNHTLKLLWNLSLVALKLAANHASLNLALSSLSIFLWATCLTWLSWIPLILLDLFYSFSFAFSSLILWVISLSTNFYLNTTMY
jgi:hypothetical protein